tara:strand:- start:169 stop:1272 length:1104 start_codon:yes stop_codon:yes gene_type:complete
MKKSILNRSILLGLLLVLVIISCDSDGISEDQAQIEYNRKALLNNTFTHGILPLHTAFINQADVLKEKATSFEQNSSLENLLRIQGQWESLTAIWKQCEVYNIGEVEDSFIHTRINTWPTNYSNIEEYINSSVPIDIDFINSVGSSSKGVSAVEYLLFKSDQESVLAEMQSDARRVDYLVALVQDLSNLSNEIFSIWEGYGPTYISAVQNDLDGGLNQTVNAMVTLIEEIIYSKLGRPLGDYNGGIVDFEETEAFRSDISLALIKNNIEELNRTFTGDYIANTRKIGFDEYLRDINNDDLRIKIKEALENIILEISLFDESLNSALQNNLEKVFSLQSYCNDLLFLIKVDMASSTGSTITFNDNDGD